MTIPHRQPLTICQKTPAALLRQLKSGHALVPERRLPRLMRAWTRVQDDPTSSQIYRALQLSVSALRAHLIERLCAHGIRCERVKQQLSFVMGGEAPTPLEMAPSVSVLLHDSANTTTVQHNRVSELERTNRFVWGWGRIIHPVAYYLDANVAMFSGNAIGWHIMHRSARDVEIMGLRARDAWPMHLTFESTKRASAPRAHPFMLFVHDHVDSLQLSSWPRSLRMYLAQLAPVSRHYPHSRQFQGPLVARGLALESPDRWSPYHDAVRGDWALGLASAFFQPWIHAILRDLGGAATLRAQVNDALDETPLRETALRAFDIALERLIENEWTFQRRMGSMLHA